MNRKNNGRAIRAAVCARTKEARQKAGLTSREVAEFLAIPHSTYTKYEGVRAEPEPQTPIPDELKARFAQLVKIDLHWLITGRRSRIAR